MADAASALQAVLAAGSPYLQSWAPLVGRAHDRVLDATADRLRRPCPALDDPRLALLPFTPRRCPPTTPPITYATNGSPPAGFAPTCEADLLGPAAIAQYEAWAVLGSDSSTSIHVLDHDGANSPQMQHLHLVSLAPPLPQCFSHARHGYGEPNPAAAFAPRGRFAELAALAAQLGVRLVRLPVPAVFDAILREFHAAFPDRVPRKQPERNFLVGKRVGEAEVPGPTLLAALCRWRSPESLKLQADIQLLEARAGAPDADDE